MAAIFYALSSLKAKLGDKERGATAVEYGIMVAAIAVAIITTVFLIGPELDQMFDAVLTPLEAKTP
ncbi:Flp family type IVb pilin [Ornithinimicrobium pekingense]|uniref:Flp family type IVb pilin n=1 Tax=Ornithinimicrobium pekingense TaxID=384677 RepID=A0ABQ2FA58_9MICO|nr:Flp family type IVb pilin [Ornithinimicrobium pekingense]GGK68640.1 hypothetical protein GCM10011509_16320 [Ornithinimicrobium pekingense]